MPAKDRAELAGAAVTGAYALEELLEAYQSVQHHNDRTKEHVAKAAISSAIAVGLFEMSKHDRNLHHDTDPDHEHEHHHHRHHSKDPQNYCFDQPKRRGTHDWTKEEENGHKRRLLEEAAAAYALGRRMLGEKSHPIATVIAEGLGVIAVLKEGKKYLED